MCICEVQGKAGDVSLSAHERLSLEVAGQAPCGRSSLVLFSRNDANVLHKCHHLWKVVVANQSNACEFCEDGVTPPGNLSSGEIHTGLRDTEWQGEEGTHRVEPVDFHGKTFGDIRHVNCHCVLFGVYQSAAKLVLELVSAQSGVSTSHSLEQFWRSSGGMSG